MATVNVPASYQDKLYPKIVHNFKPLKGKTIISYKNEGRRKFDATHILYKIEQKDFIHIEGPPVGARGKPSSPDEVFAIGSKSDVGFALLGFEPENADKAMKVVEDQNEYIDSVSPMTDELGNTRYFIPRLFTVQLREDQLTAPFAGDELIDRLGYRIVTRESTEGYYTLEVPTGSSLFEVIQEWNNKPEVRFSEPLECGLNDSLSVGFGEYISEVDPFRFWTPSDPMYTSAIAWGLFKINASGAWNTSPTPTRGRSDVVVVIIDSGAKLTHEDLDGSLETQGSDDWDFTGSGTVPNDSNGQGTAIAGVAAAESNAVGNVGLANLCKFMPLKINLNGLSPYTDRYNAINYIGANTTGKAVVNAATKRYIINIGWKMSSDVSSIHSALTTAYNNNVLIVCAAGNTEQNLATNPMYPAAYSETIPVGATESTDVIWNDVGIPPGTEGAGTNYGTRTSDGTMVLGAPGKTIRTTKYSSLANNTYEDRTGTAMAAAFISALGALIWSRNKNKCGNFTWNKATIRSIITNTANCDNISGIGANNGKINYRINAQKALNDANNRAC